MTSVSFEDEPFGVGTGLPSATGSRRITWSDLPARVASEIELMLGAKVVGAASQPGGFSNGLAARLSLDNGRGVFLKAVSSRLSPSVGEFHRRERAVAGGMPDGLPVPRLLDAHDDGLGGLGVRGHRGTPAGPAMAAG